jgi:AraC-like DNA-binding protein
MPLLADEFDRASASPFVDTIMSGRSVAAGAVIRPAESQWHLIVMRAQGRQQTLLTGPLTSSGVVHFQPDTEFLWIRFNLGVFMPKQPARPLRDRETPLPTASGRAFWLDSAAWQFPTYENADTFLARLARAGLLACDPLIPAALAGQPTHLAERTVRQRFVAATGQTQTHIRQVRRAQQAAALLRGGTSILDTVEAAGYFDQPHLTRALRRLIGYTPAQLARPRDWACRSVQDTPTSLIYDPARVPADRL